MLSVDARDNSNACARRADQLVDLQRDRPVGGIGFDGFADLARQNRDAVLSRSTYAPSSPAISVNVVSYSSFDVSKRDTEMLSLPHAKPDRLMNDGSLKPHCPFTSPAIRLPITGIVARRSGDVEMQLLDGVLRHEPRFEQLDLGRGRRLVSNIPVSGGNESLPFALAFAVLSSTWNNTSARYVGGARKAYAHPSASAISVTMANGAPTPHDSAEIVRQMKPVRSRTRRCSGFRS